MRSRIFGAIGVVWGGVILVSGYVRGLHGNGAYAAGQMIGLAFGALLLLVGARYLLKSGQKAGK
jgi:hypothetical protein